MNTYRSTPTYPVIKNGVEIEIYPSAPHLKVCPVKPTKRRTYGTALTRKQRRQLHRTELLQILSELKDTNLCVLAAQFNAVTEGPSNNVLLETSCKQIVLHMSVTKAKDLARRFKDGSLTLRPALAKGAGQGQVGTQFKGCFLRMRPMKTSKVPLVLFVEREENSNSGSDTTSMDDTDADEEYDDTKGSAEILMLLKHSKPKQRLRLLKRKREESTCTTRSKKQRCSIPTIKSELIVKSLTSPRLCAGGDHRLEVLCQDQQPKYFRIFPGCVGGDILRQISDCRLFSVDYSKPMFLRDTEGTIFLHNTPVGNSKRLFLVQ